MTLSNGDVTRRCFDQAVKDFPEIFAHVSPMPAAESDRSISGCYNVNNNLVSLGWGNTEFPQIILEQNTVICGYSDTFPTGLNCSRT